MVNAKNSLDILIDDINNLECISRLHKLEVYIDKNEDIKDKLEEIKNVQKQMVNSAYYHKPNAKKEYEEKLIQLKQQLKDIPFVEEYIDLLNEAYYILLNITSTIESEINNSLK